MTKLMVVTVSVIRKIGYKGVLVSLPLKDFKDIDAIFNQKYDDFLNGTAPRHLGGLGIPPFSATVQEKKTMDADGGPCGRGETKGYSGKFTFPGGKSEWCRLLKWVATLHRHTTRN